MHYHAEELRSLAARADLAAVAQRGEVMSRLAYMLEVFRGCMRGSGPKSQPALLGVVKQIADPLVLSSSHLHSTGRCGSFHYAWGLSTSSSRSQTLCCACLRYPLALAVTSTLCLCRGLSAGRLKGHPNFGMSGLSRGMVWLCVQPSRSHRASSSGAYSIPWWGCKKVRD